MLRKILIGIGGLVGLVVLGVAGLYGVVSHKVSKTYETPLPNIQRATTPEALARGEMIYRSMCAECHAKPGETHATGAQMMDLPAELGFFHSANITSDPVAGIGNLKDEEIARMIIHAINRDGKIRPMAQYRWMSDEDVAAVIGYLRSDSPDFAPSPDKAPPSQLTFPGKIIQSFILGINPEPRGALKAPPKAVTAEYGKYLAMGVYECLFCHTESFANNDVKEKSPNAFAGGFEYDMSTLGGQGFIYSANITQDETNGIGKWNLEQFKLALREGVTPDRHILRRPMPRYRYLDDVEIEAIFTFLKTVKPAPMPKLAHEPIPRPKADSAVAGGPEHLFNTLGCTYCHGPKGQFRDRLKNAVGKQPEEVAKWIRNPESFKPGTQMPTFASLIDENQAVELAKWVQAKGGTP